MWKVRSIRKPTCWRKFMKLDRNVNPDGRGKYALLKLRRQAKPFTVELQDCAAKLRDAGLLDFGDTAEDEFFVIRLKDKYAAAALDAYATAAFNDDPEYAREIAVLANKADNHPLKKKPD